MLSFLFSPNGRISRGQLWVKFLIPYIIISLIAMAIDTILKGMGLLGFGLFGIIVSLFYLWPQFAVQIKRYHDIGMTGWLVLVFAILTAGFYWYALQDFIPAIWTDPQAMQAQVEAMGAEKFMEQYGARLGGGGLGAIAVLIVEFVLLYCLPGKEGDTKYGPDPRVETDAI